MSKWKLCRQTFGNEEFELNEGEITIGRSTNNTIKLESIIISRNHCFIRVNQDEVVITDLKSSNGVYVGLNKIPPNLPYPLSNNDLIGLGWAFGAPIDDIKDKEKYVYKLVKNDRTETNLKRKLEIKESIPVIKIIEHGIQSESNSEESEKITETEYNSCQVKKCRLEPEFIDLTEEEKEDLQNYEHEDIIHDVHVIHSDSDCDSTNIFKKLPQISPEKLRLKFERPITSKINSTYSHEDIPIDSIDLCEENDEVPEHSKSPLEEPVLQTVDVHEETNDFAENNENNEINDPAICKSPTTEAYLQSLGQVDNSSNNVSRQMQIQKISNDVMKISSRGDENRFQRLGKTTSETEIINNGPSKKLEILGLPVSHCNNKSNIVASECVSKGSKNKLSSTKKQVNRSKKLPLTNSQKEKRRQNLKEIAQKNITSESNTLSRLNVTDSNNIGTDKCEKSEETHTRQKNELSNEIKESKTNYQPRPRNAIKIIEPHVMQTGKKRTAHNNKTVPENKIHNDNDVALKQSAKKVHFNEMCTKNGLEIESNNNLRKIETANKYQRSHQRQPLKNNFLKEMLKWNPQWLVEQKILKKLPPILSNIDQLLPILTTFDSHENYARQMTDVLLIELWELLTIGQDNTNENNYLDLQIESLPPAPTQKSSQLFTMSFTTQSTTKLQSIPRDGDIMILKFSDKGNTRERTKNTNKLKFCYIYNVQHEQSPNSKYLIMSCKIPYSSVFETLRPGETIKGCSIACIKRELSYLEALEHLEDSPLRNAILKPKPAECLDTDNDVTINMETEWTAHLNPSQRRAVIESVRAALKPTPQLKMIQGPPGTGKSSVICAIVMTYFYGNTIQNGNTRKKQNRRGKILICATSNAAVDELVIRLQKVKKSLDPGDQFLMVRVGPLDSMHECVKEISAQVQAKAKILADLPQHVRQEIALIQEHINRRKTENRDDPVKAAYCDDQVRIYSEKMDSFRRNNCTPRQLKQAERLLVEKADIVATTLASAVNNKMQGLKGIELCIVDEAGQAIELETLLPLSLGVTKMTLVGDPQQLPGYTRSQHAKKLGLDRSLFSRLSSWSESWGELRPLVLLDQQYRMHPTIADYPNRAFYGGRVHSVPRTPPKLQIPPYCILDVSAVRQEDSEAWGAARVTLAMCEAAHAHRPPLSVAIITPYVKQRDLLRKCLRTLDESMRSLEVNTVDSFQGQERDVVVVSLGRRHGVGFLSHAGRMNVLLTRAKHVLLICLDTNAIHNHEQWRTLVEDAKIKKCFKNLPHHICKPASSKHYVPTKEVLEYLRT